MRDARELLSPHPSPSKLEFRSGPTWRGVAQFGSVRTRRSGMVAMVDLSPRFSSVPVNKACGSCFAFGWPCWRGSVLLHRGYLRRFSAVSLLPRFPSFILAPADPPSEDAIPRRALAKIMQEKPLWLLEKGRIRSETLLGRLPRARTGLVEQSNWFCITHLSRNVCRECRDYTYNKNNVIKVIFGSNFVNTGWTLQSKCRE